MEEINVYKDLSDEVLMELYKSYTKLWSTGQGKDTSRIENDIALMLVEAQNRGLL